MKRWNALLLGSTLMFGLPLATAQPPGTSPTPPTSIGPHGGRIHPAGDFQCEAVFSSKAVEVFVFDRAGQPVATRNARGRFTLNLDGNPRSYRYDLYPQSGENASSNALGVGIDLSRVQDRTASVEFALYGVAQQPVSFAASFQRSLTPEQIAISRQRICPVSGKPLGSMGAPPKVRIGKQDVYVCCAGCTKALKANPEVHLAKLTQPALVKATPADAAAIAQQKICPVMDEPLQAMGGPWKTTVRGRDVFLCCKGCLKFVQKEPQKYLAKLAAPPPVTATRADAAAIAKQRVCPIMDEPLDSMGVPWKVTVKGQPVYVCCKGCIKKVEEHPDVVLRKVAQLSTNGRIVR